MRKGAVALRLAAGLLFLLALVRGIGGLLLIINGQGVLTEAKAPDYVMRAMGAGLVLVACLAATAGVLLLRHKPFGFTLALGALLAFVLGGLVNGALLFGRPRLAGTAANTAVALIILACVSAGRGAIATHESSDTPTTKGTNAA